jgi:hypothetical protein
MTFGETDQLAFIQRITVGKDRNRRLRKLVPGIFIFMEKAGQSAKKTSAIAFGAFGISPEAISPEIGLSPVMYNAARRSDSRWIIDSRMKRFLPAFDFLPI